MYSLYTDKQIASVVNICYNKTFFIALNWINCVVKLQSWTLTFHKVVRQQIWGEVVVLIPPSSADSFWIQQWKIYEIWSTFAEVIAKTKGGLLTFLRHGVCIEEWHGSGHQPYPHKNFPIPPRPTSFIPIPPPDFTSSDWLTDWSPPHPHWLQPHPHPIPLKFIPIPIKSAMLTTLQYTVRQLLKNCALLRAKCT